MPWPRRPGAGWIVDVCMTADSAYTAALEQIAAAGGHVDLYPDRAGVLYIHEKLVLADAGTAVGQGSGRVDQLLHQLHGLQPRTRSSSSTSRMPPGSLATLSDAFQRDFAGAPAL